MLVAGSTCTDWRLFWLHSSSFLWYVFFVVCFFTCTLALHSQDKLSKSCLLFERFGSSLRSSIGKMRGFFGLHTIAFVLMVAVVRKLKPVVFLHECTQNFQFTIFLDILEDLWLGILPSAFGRIYVYIIYVFTHICVYGLTVLGEHATAKVSKPWTLDVLCNVTLLRYALHHQFLRPSEFGCPASRTRSYSALIRHDYKLAFDFDSHFFRLKRLVSPEIDCGIFAIAEEEEVGTHVFT